VTERLAALARELDRSVDDVHELWAERAAIREHDGGMPRAEAERAAFDDVEQVVRAARRGPRSAPAAGAAASAPTTADLAGKSRR
jgi:hypothetical protein